MPAWYEKTTEEVVKELQTNIETGLTSEEAKRRLEKYGPNRFQEYKKPSIWKMLWDQINNVLIYILIVAAIVSGIVSEITDSIIIFIVIALNAVIGIIQESKAEKALEELKKMSTPIAVVKRDGEVKEISSEEVVPGDIVLIDAGRFIPADLRLVETVNLQMEESALTGESVPVDKNAEPLAEGEVPLGDQRNMAFMSTLSTYGRGVGIAVHTGMSTEIGKIAQMLGNQQKEITPLQKKLDELGKILGIGAILVCILMFIIGLIQGRDVLEMFMTAVSLAVAAIPEGLLAIVTIVLAIGVQKMIKHNAIVRKLPAVETLGAVSVICSDKTGTLTQNKMTVTKMYVDGEMIDPDSIDLQNEVHQQFINGMMLCTDATVNEDKQTGDPTEIALIVAGMNKGLTKESLEKDFERVFELPFDSDRKMMTTVHKQADQFVSYTKGALDRLLPKMTSIYKNGKVLPITEEDKKEISVRSDEMSELALRVLAVAKKDVHSENEFNNQLEDNLTFLGLVGMIDPPREEVKASIAETKKAGIRTVMITGDHQKTALAIARELGIASDVSQTMTGQELNEMTDEELQEKVEDIRVFARVSPEHKVRIVQALKARGHIASMTGDGVNDAPSLKQADVGVAMGITGTDVAKGAADIVLTDDNFSTIVKAVEQGRNIFQNIKKSIIFLLSCNLGEITAIFIAILLGLKTPLTAVQILFVNLITDTLPAIALGMDPDDPDVMKEKPRNPKESIFAGGAGSFVIINGILIGLITLFAFLEGLRFYTGASSIFTIDHANIPDDALTHARTMAFITLSISQLFHSFNLRNQKKSIFQVGLTTNKYLLGALGVGVLIQIALVYIPFLQKIFGIYLLSFNDWVFIILISLIPVVVNEVVKLVRRMLDKN